MTARFWVALILAMGVHVVSPVSADACSCGGTASSAMAVRAADLVFVGTVARVDGRKPWSRVNADGSVSGGLTSDPPVTTFQTQHVYRGPTERQVVIAGDGSNCDVPFQQGEAWLVYAQLRGGRVTTHKCTRTRLRAEAEASQDLAYLDGLEGGRQQGIVYGDVLRRVVDADGKPALQALSEPLRVIAAGPAGRFEVTTDRWGPYQLVLPPGSFELRIERGRGTVTDLAPIDLEVWIDRVGGPGLATKPILVEAGSERRLALVVEYRN